MLFFNRPQTVRPTQPSFVPKQARPQGIQCPDMLSLIGFNDDAQLLSPFVSAFDAKFVNATQGLPAAVGGGSTNITAGLRLANNLLSRMPKGLRRRIWLLSDGGGNHPEDLRGGITSEVERARQQFTNVNCIGFGDPGQFNKELLTRISNATHNGKYFEATTISALGATLRRAAGPRQHVNHRGEATAFVIDCSGSMVLFKMGERRRIDVVRDAMVDLIRYKQAMWS
jgi:Mg-chelatase subunit ChlD